MSLSAHCDVGAELTGKQRPTEEATASGCDHPAGRGTVAPHAGNSHGAMGSYFFSQLGTADDPEEPQTAQGADGAFFLGEETLQLTAGQSSSFSPQPSF